MSRLLNRLNSLLVTFGFDLVKAFRALRGLGPYCRDYLALKKQRPATGDPFPLTKPYPCLFDRYDTSGTAEGHYFHQDLLVAQRIFDNNPETHVDVGSRVDGLVAHVASFRPIKVIDIRPLDSRVTNIEFLQADMMGDLDERLRHQTDSLSCLHALEHFGLGRYGDPVRNDGHQLGFENLDRLLRPGGKLYFSTPMGPQRIEFNAHRVFSLRYLIDRFAERYRVDRFSYVDDRGDLHKNVELDEHGIASNYGCRYGCAILELTKNTS